MTREIPTPEQEAQVAALVAKDMAEWNKQFPPGTVFLSAQMICVKALSLLRNDLQADGITFKSVPLPTYTFSTGEAKPVPVKYRPAPIQVGVDAEFDDADIALSLQQFTDRYLGTIIKELAQAARQYVRGAVLTTVLLPEIALKEPGIQMNQESYAGLNLVIKHGFFGTREKSHAYRFWLLIETE